MTAQMLYLSVIPNAATMAQKIVQYQAVLQLAQSAPQLYNLPLLASSDD
jgi:hypothetical protein